jgi:hypothetical protein
MPKLLQRSELGSGRFRAWLRCDVSCCCVGGQMRKLQRVKVLFEDDLRAAVASFDTAFGEVEQRVLQVVHNFIIDKKMPESVLSKATKRHRGSHRKSTSMGSGSIGSGSIPSGSMGSSSADSPEHSSSMEDRPSQIREGAEGEVAAAVAASEGTAGA